MYLSKKIASVSFKRNSISKVSEVPSNKPSKSDSVRAFVQKCFPMREDSTSAVQFAAPAHTAARIGRKQEDSQPKESRKFEFLKKGGGVKRAIPIIEKAIKSLGKKVSSKKTEKMPATPVEETPEEEPTAGASTPIESAPVQELVKAQPAQTESTDVAPVVRGRPTLVVNVEIAKPVEQSPENTLAVAKPEAEALTLKVPVSALPAPARVDMKQLAICARSSTYRPSAPLYYYGSYIPLSTAHKTIKRIARPTPLEVVAEVTVNSRSTSRDDSDLVDESFDADVSNETSSSDSDYDYSDDDSSASSSSACTAATEVLEELVNDAAKEPSSPLPAPAPVPKPSEFFGVPTPFTQAELLAKGLAIEDLHTRSAFTLSKAPEQAQSASTVNTVPSIRERMRKLEAASQTASDSQPNTSGNRKVLALRNSLSESSDARPLSARQWALPSHLNDKKVGNENTQMELDFLRSRSSGAKGQSILDRVNILGGSQPANDDNTAEGKGLTLRQMVILQKHKVASRSLA